MTDAVQPATDAAPHGIACRPDIQRATSLLRARGFHRSRRPRPLTAALLAVAALAIPFLSATAEQPAVPLSDSSKVRFNRDIRAILSDHCFACHGPDENTRKARLRLDIQEESRRVLRSGNAAIVPGDLEASSLIARITSPHPDEVMPPPETKKPLTPEEIELLKRWVAQGAEYEGHWAYIPPSEVTPPAVEDSSWVRNDIDRFILQSLSQAGLKPSPEAPREKLLRRVTLDLTGLPPTVEEIDAFLADEDPMAYEKVVDRLLASPHYGERMAQQWLDLARYGETQGYHHDRHRDMWHWRDWVIRAFNDNKPFDEFTIEQLAGDLLPNPTRDQLIATGFHRNEMTTSEGGALPEEYIVKYAVGRVDTTARVWLGTSMACAECHDHKYDPISQKDYYRFFAFFFNTPEHGLDREELNPVPRITLETPEQRERARQMDREIEALKTAEHLVRTAPRKEWDDAQAQWEQAHRAESVGGWKPLELVAARVISPESATQTEDGTLRLAADAGRGPVVEVTLRTELPDLDGLRLDFTAPEANPEWRLTGLSAEIRAANPASAGAAAAPVASPWRSVGPFTGKSGAEAFNTEFGPEKNADPHARFDRDRLAWKERGEWADVLKNAAGVTYAERTITVDERRIVDAEVVAPGPVRAWLNGHPVLAAADGSGSHRVRLWLRPGDNRFLLKMVSSGEDREWRFTLLPEPVSRASLEFAAGAATAEAKEHPFRGALDASEETGWSPAGDASASISAFVRARERFGFRDGTEITVRLAFGPGAERLPIDSLRISGRASSTLAEFVDLPAPIRSLLLREPDSLDESARAEMRDFYRQRYVPEVQETQRLLAARTRERDEFRNSWPTAMVMSEANPPRETYFLIRGQYNNPGEKVDPGVPESLFPWQPGLPTNRLGLAKWLVHPDNPLTARVVVNRYWQRYFGAGLVRTSEDFGAQGEWPTHPALLDWLAREFIRSGWDIKAMQRLIVTSATYRQDAVTRPEHMELDPENRLLARAPRFRLDAENIRDLAMAASGLLNPKIGGPSVFPYQPPGLWAQVAFEGTGDWEQSRGADNYRRGLYTYWRRSIPYASFTIFDAPSREVCTVRRPRTNTPLQALALMNDPVYVEAARALGYRVLKHGGDSLDDRIQYAFRLVLGRRANDAELGILRRAWEREFESYAGEREAANQLIHVGASAPPVDVDIAELAAWTIVANTLLNLDEAITRG